MTEKSVQDMRRLGRIVPKLEENSKIRLDQMMNEFLAHPELPEVVFPNKLSSIERAYVHFKAASSGLESVSYGSGSNRRLHLKRLAEKTTMDAKLVALTAESLQGVLNLARAPPVVRIPRYPKQIEEVERRQGIALAEVQKVQASRLSNGPFPKVPKPRSTNTFLEYRRRLPIWNYQQRIIELLENHRVIFIKGSTGCGKTTQVGQFILDHACETSQKVRVICTVPRRIAAVSVSERVAVERGERVGQTVGYQIRLESRISPDKTLLTYCTSGILLRSLVAPEYKVLKNTTHIIIDEIHERDKQTDFLLTCLRDILPLVPNLRLIIMGADMNNELFTDYFGKGQESPTLQVEGRLYPVESYFLEDILDMLQYENHDMQVSKRYDDQASAYNRMLEKLSKTSVSVAEKTEDPDISQELPAIDILIQRFWTTGRESALETFLHKVRCREVSVNYQHSIAKVTMLMAAVVRGLVEVVSEILSLDADLKIRSKTDAYDYNAIEWASDHQQHEVLKVLLEHQYQTQLTALTSRTMDAHKSERLTRYLKSVDEDRVDLMLILKLLHQIHITTLASHAVLVFLPGYDEIVTLKHLILTDDKQGFRRGNYRIFMLHSNIQTGDQRAAFDKLPKGIRKIVLSTNIAESSLTIEDVVYVIDAGKSKEKLYDSMTGVSQLKTGWISKAAVNQRRGRAGRCREGICYHLFSSARYEAMPEFPIPEIVRSSLQELCLHARSFLRSDVKIEVFFSRIPEPPAPISVKKSVELLKVMGALDENEGLTKLGSHLLEFPVEPFLGKALVYAIVFRCLDPILTLVSIISYKDPFQLPSDPRDKQKAHERKMKFASDSYSDHMAYLKAFQDWEKCKLFKEYAERKFVQENYISPYTFEMTYAIRTQLLGQLRASGFVKTKGGGDLQELNQNSNNWSLVKGVLVATLYPNICAVDRAKNVLYNSFNNKVEFHNSTTVTKKKNGVKDIPTDWIIFDEMMQLGHSNSIKGCTCVSTAAIALFAGGFTSSNERYDHKVDLGCDESAQFGLNPIRSSRIKINQWIALEGTQETIDALLYLRRKIKDLILKRMELPSTPFLPDEQNTIQTIAALLVSEDKALGLKNVDGIGQWPKLVSGNFMSTPKAGYDLGTASERNVPNYRYFVVEVQDSTRILEIMRNDVWLVPQWMKEKLYDNLNGGRTESLGQPTVVFFWVSNSRQFTGAMVFNATTELNIQTEVPVKILSTKIVTLQNAEHQIGFKTGCDLPMNGLELDCELGAALLSMFVRAFPESGAKYQTRIQF